MVILQRLRFRNRQQIGAAADGLIGVYDGKELLAFDFDQVPYRDK